MPDTFSFLRTRLAPTPSGYLHAGNAFNFLLTAALAKKHGAKLLLRIDDLDRERYRPAYAQDVFDTLCFLNVQWDEGPQNVDDFERRWSQRWRIELYKKALIDLSEAGAVFACTCSRTQTALCDCYEKRLPLNTPNASWRLVTNDEPIAVRTFAGDAVASLPAEMKNFVVRKKDGLPAYQLSSVVDDLHFGIDFIVRGQDLWASTLAQLFLAKRLEEERFSSVVFYHHPLLASSGGGKLSKSAGASSVKQWREEGKTPEAFFNYLAALLRQLPEIKNIDDVLNLFVR